MVDSEALLNQITLDCLLNKETMGNHIMKQWEQHINKEELNFYRKRIYNLFKEIISNKPPSDMPPDVKYAYDNFVNATVHYFKTIDNNDIIQAEYADLDKLNESITYDLSSNQTNAIDADKLLMRSIKMDLPPTLDKYVTKTVIQKKEAEIILPKQKEINLLDPKLQTKGLK